MSSIFKYSEAGAVESEKPKPPVFGVLEPEPSNCDGSATLVKSLHSTYKRSKDVPDIEFTRYPPAGYPAILKAGYRISG